MPKNRFLPSESLQSERENRALRKTLNEYLKYNVHIQLSAVRAQRRGRSPPDGINKEGFMEGGELEWVLKDE